MIQCIFIPCGRLSVIMLAVSGPNDYINYTLNVHTSIKAFSHSMCIVNRLKKRIKRNELNAHLLISYLQITSKFIEESRD